MGAIFPLKKNKNRKVYFIASMFGSIFRSSTKSWNKSDVNINNPKS